MIITPNTSEARCLNISKSTNSGISVFSSTAYFSISEFAIHLKASLALSLYKNLSPFKSYNKKTFSISLSLKSGKVKAFFYYLFSSSSIKKSYIFSGLL